MVYALGSIARRIALFGMVPLLGRSLSERDFAAWSLIVVLVPAATAVVDLGLSKAISRLYFDSVAKGASGKPFLVWVTRVRIETLLILMPVTVGGLWVAWDLVVGDQLVPQWFSLLVAVAAGGEAVVLAVTSFSRAHHLIAPFAFVRFGQGLALPVVVWPLSATFGLSGAVVALAIVYGVSGLCAAAWAISGWRIESGQPRFGPSRRVLLRFGAPLIAHDLTWWARSSATLIVVSHTLSVADVAGFSLALAALSVVALLPWSFDFTVSPYYYRWRVSDREWRAMTRSSFYVIQGATLAAVCFCIPLFSNIRELVFGDALQPADRWAGPLLAAAAAQPLYFFSIKSLMFHRRTVTLSTITVATSVAYLVGLPLAMTGLGEKAAAFGPSVAFIFPGIVAYCVSRQIEAQPVDLRVALSAVFGVHLLAAAAVYDLAAEEAVWSLACLGVALGAWMAARSVRSLSADEAFTFDTRPDPPVAP